MGDKKKGVLVKLHKAKLLASKQKTLLDLFPKKTTDTLAEATVSDATQAQPVFSGGLPESPDLKPTPILPTTVPVQDPISRNEIIEIIDNETPPNPGSPLNHLELASALEPSYSSRDGRAQHDPIILDSSPAKPTVPFRPEVSKPLAPLFTPRPRKSPLTSASSSSKVKLPDAPFPDRDSQHIRGPQSVFTTSDLVYPRRQRQASLIKHIPIALVSVNDNDSDHPKYTSSDSEQTLTFVAASDRVAYLETIPDEHKRLHCAISHLVGDSSAQSTASSSSHKAWADKWHPTRAEEVLGNEQNALYLRDWLRALEIQLDHTEGLPSNSDMHGNKGKTKESIRGTKRPRIVRAVAKQRGRKKQKVDSDDSDDWIVYSDGSEEESVQEEEDLRRVQPRSRLYRKKSLESSPPLKPTPPRAFDSLTNTILLTGPPGTGKTAAVYACAEELGWEVFEVYPGIGKRNGASVESMVGDVGKNHLVRQTNPRKGTKLISKGRNAFAALLRRELRTGEGRDGLAEEKSSELDSEEHRPQATDFGFLTSSNAESEHRTKDETTSVRQSVILLEEVDILFKEDVNFWPTVTNLIKDCRRPVICTCNDISLLPTMDLPLQTILTFQPCHPLVAASYLQALCCAEGYSVERDSLLRLYDSTYKLDSIDLPDVSTPPVTGDFPVPDLRRTIHCLQLLCPTIPDITLGGDTRWWEQEPDSFESLADWKWLIAADMGSQRDSSEDQDQDSLATIMGKQTPLTKQLTTIHTDLISFADSYLVRSPLDTPEALALSSFGPSLDDEIGHTILFNPARATDTPGDKFGLHDHDKAIAMTAIRISRGAFEAAVAERPMSIVKNDNSFRTRGLFQARADYQLQVGQMIRNILPLSASSIPRSVIYMDYEPWIRFMIAADDMQESLHMQKERSGRTTRNSGGEYIRTVNPTEEERDLLTATILGSNFGTIVEHV